ncbi:MAG: sulfate adenylyltransferase [Lentisphaerae bacterium]|nr:sulfate adenylyltransferase [Lentisphaerota bacterium]
MPQTAPGLVRPHGGILKPLLLTGEALDEARARAASLPVVHMSSRETSDLIMLAVGAFSPLDGFMRRDDYRGVVRDMHMSDRTLWPVPITLSPKPGDPDVQEGDQVALMDEESGELMGTLRIEEKYGYDKRAEARGVFGTEDEAHPGVAKVYAQGEVLLGGPVRVFSELRYPETYGEYYARPADTRRVFAEKGWKTVAAFQTRNPIHRSHEYCTKIALEICDGILIHPIVGKLKGDDIPADVRMDCYRALLDKYYPRDRVVCRVYPMEMRYGGPREAVLHAIFRQNYGCSHLIVGRDHAGVGKYYGPFDAQNIFDRIPADELEIRPLKIDWTFWCRACEGMASTKTCPHAKEERVLISGTELRAMLDEGRRPPHEFTRPEVADILMAYYRKAQAQ